MMHSVEVRNWDRDNPRARKVAKRRDQDRRMKRQSPRQQLMEDPRHTKVVGEWSVRVDGPLEHLFIELRSRARKVIESRRKVDLHRKRLATKALEECRELRLTRYSRDGAAISWFDGINNAFFIRIREVDCIPNLEQPDDKCLDDWQWIMSMSEPDQALALEIAMIYEDMNRAQIRKLIDRQSVTYYSHYLGLIRVSCNAGHLHTDRLPDVPAELLEVAHAA